MAKIRRFIPLFGLGLIPVSVILLIESFSSGGTLVCAPLSITLLLVANILLVANNISKNIVFVVFQVTFFLFMIAGPLLDAFDGVDFFRSFAPSVVTQTYICYWLAAFAMWCYLVYRLHGRKKLAIRKRASIEKSKHPYDLRRIRSYSRFLFYICITAYLAVTVDKILFRQVSTLQEYYANYNTSSNLPGVVVKVADCHLIALCIFLATKPTKKEAKLPLLVFLSASALTIIYGVRNVVLLNAMLIFIYFILRNGDGEEVWLHKKAVVIGIIVSPVAIVLLQAFDAFRRSIAFNIFDIKQLFSFSLVKEFFVSQSVSSYLLPNAITHMSQLGGQPVPYTIGTLYTYLRQNMIVRFFTGASAFGSNSIESAMSSGNLGARLAFYMYRETFLTGTGMGGSFVADLFVDFSYVGVFLGTLLACVFVSWLSNSARGNTSPYFLAFSLVAIRWICYMPRDSYFAWAMQAFSFMNILFVLMMIVLCKVRTPGQPVHMIQKQWK